MSIVLVLVLVQKIGAQYQRFRGVCFFVLPNLEHIQYYIGEGVFFSVLPGTGFNVQCSIIISIKSIKSINSTSRQ